MKFRAVSAWHSGELIVFSANTSHVVSAADPVVVTVNHRHPLQINGRFQRVANVATATSPSRTSDVTSDNS